MGIIMDIKSFIKRCDWLALILAVFTFAGCYFYISYTSWPLNDIGRELYFPQLVLEGKVLYKDIFNLFGPFSYLFNALLYKIFGSGFATMYYFGYFIAVTLILSIYEIGKEVSDKKFAFLVSILAIVTGVTTTLNFNFYMPYAYSILYGMIMFIWSAYFYIKYIKTKDGRMILWSMFFAGVAIANKYEFLLYVALLTLLAAREFFIKKEIKANIFIISLILLMLPTALCFGFLFYQGLTFSDLSNAVNMVKTIVLTDSYKYFYKEVGTLFSFEHFGSSIAYFVTFALSIGMAYLTERLFEEKSKLSFIAVLFTIYFVYYLLVNFGFNSVFSYISYLVLFFIIYERKNLSAQTLFWSVSAFLASYKVFFFCFLKFYGVFFAPIMLLALIALIWRYKKLKTYLSYYLILLSVYIMYTDIILRNYIGGAVNMPSPKITTYFNTSYKIDRIIQYIKMNTSEDDKVVIYPEGVTINYLTNRKTENIYYALSPAYLELFGEDKLIEYFEANKPEYFILTSEQMYEYGKRQMCKDYAYKFCMFLRKNYEKVKTYGYVLDSEPYYIYKKI